VVDDRGLLGHPKRIGQRQHLHRQPDPDPASPTGDSSRADQWGSQHGALRPEVRLTQPEGVEPSVFSNLDQVEPLPEDRGLG
jgi:hypothetical protein